MQIHDIPIGKLIAYDKNAKIHSDKQNREIANSLLRFGWKQPLVVDKDNVLIVGHGRLEGAKIASLTDSRFLTAPCIIADDLTDEEIKAYRLADNKLNESPWDFDLLSDELSDITALDMSEFGFDMSAFEEEPAEVVEDDYEESLPEQPKAKLGDIYQLGRHKLMCGDSTNPENVKELTGGVLVDMLITDPPYNVALGQSGGHALRPSEAKQLHRRTDGKIIQNDSWNTDEEFVDFLVKVFNAGLEVMKPGATFYIWYADTQALNFRLACKEAGMQVRQNLIWNKNVFTFGRQDYQWKHEPCLYGWKEGASHLWASDRKQTTVIDFNKPVKSDLHPTMKPVGLFDYQIQNNTKGGDAVLDLFNGSGTTIMACEQNGRQAYCMELDPRYVDAAIDRWEKFTGQKAVKLN